MGPGHFFGDGILFSSVDFDVDQRILCSFFLPRKIRSMHVSTKVKGKTSNYNELTFLMGMFYLK